MDSLAKGWIEKDEQGNYEYTNDEWEEMWRKQYDNSSQLEGGTSHVGALMVKEPESGLEVIHLQGGSLNLTTFSG